MRYRVLSFVALLVILQIAFSAGFDAGLPHVLIDEVTVRPCAWLVRNLLGDASAVAHGASVVASGATMKVLYGCEGSEVAILLVAALLVAPMRPWRRIAGILAGLVFVFALNQARLVVLFLALSDWHEGFGALHGVVMPVVMVVAVLLYFLVVLRSGQAGDSAPLPAGGT